MLIVVITIITIQVYKRTNRATWYNDGNIKHSACEVKPAFKVLSCGPKLTTSPLLESVGATRKIPSLHSNVSKIAGWLSVAKNKDMFCFRVIQLFWIQNCIVKVFFHISPHKFQASGTYQYIAVLQLWAATEECFLQIAFINSYQFYYHGDCLLHYYNQHLIIDLWEIDTWNLYEINWSVIFTLYEQDIYTVK